MGKFTVTVKSLENNVGWVYVMDPTDKVTDIADKVVDSSKGKYQKGSISFVYSGKAFTDNDMNKTL